MTDVHDGFNVEVTELRLHKKYHFLGASADGLGRCRCHGDFVVEIKCPYSLKDKQNIKDCLPDTRLCNDETLQLKKTHRYMTQIQMQMNVYDIKRCFFVVWTPQFCFSTEVPYDESFCENIEVLVNFHRRHVAIELLTRNLELADQLTIEDGGKCSAPKTYCFCQQPETEGETMIGCDNPSCKYEWLHLKCIGIKRPPKGEWYCGPCKKKM